MAEVHLEGVVNRGATKLSMEVSKNTGLATTLGLDSLNIGGIRG